MSVLNKLKNNKKAVSPVVAAILLIGLVVVAGAAVAFIVLPMLNPPFTANKITIGDQSETGVGQGASITLNIANGHTSSVTIDAVTSFVFNNGSTQTITTFITSGIVPSTIVTGEIVTIVLVWSGAVFITGTGDTATSITLTFTSGSTSHSIIHTFS